MRGSYAKRVLAIVEASVWHTLLYQNGAS